MPVRIRLQRHGRKGRPFYWIVAADSRAKRDGKFLEKLGTYNPTSNPAQIDLNVDDAVRWLRNGAQPSETARRILSYKGALLRHHLLKGVDKGALTEEQADQKFQDWLAGKGQQIDDKKEKLAQAKADARAKALAAEKAVSDKRKAANTTVEEPEAETSVAVEEADAAEKATEIVAEGKEAAEEQSAKADVKAAATEAPEEDKAKEA